MSEFLPDAAVETVPAEPVPEDVQPENAVPVQDEPAASRADTSSSPAEESAEQAAATPAEEPAALQVPLAWHRFLTRFYLWAAALYHFARAALVFTGWSYHSISARDAVYAGLPNMQYLDWGFCALLVLGALLQAIAAGRLIKRRKNAPGMLFAAYLILLLAQAGYGAGRYILTGLTPFTGSIIGICTVCICMMVANGSYYKKRRGILNS